MSWEDMKKTRTNDWGKSTRNRNIKERLKGREKKSLKPPMFGAMTKEKQRETVLSEPVEKKGKKKPKKRLWKVGKNCAELPKKKPLPP